ncbi:MAG: hypothetical protein HC789_06915 [Microcoleus sp. CSU_2_2]|nr:hypothetical protein [Microcoleus sp. CSU_2_2]
MSFLTRLLRATHPTMCCVVRRCRILEFPNEIVEGDAPYDVLYGASLRDFGAS